MLQHLTEMTVDEWINKSKYPVFHSFLLGLRSTCSASVKGFPIEPQVNWWKAALLFNEFAPSLASIYEWASPRQHFNEPLSYSITASYKGCLISGGHRVVHSLHWWDPQTAEQPVSLHTVEPDSLRPAGKAQPGRRKIELVLTDELTISLNSLLDPDSEKERILMSDLC